MTFVWISMQTIALLYPKCAISQNMKNQERSVLLYETKQDSILISKKKIFDMLVIWMFFVAKEWQYRK